MESTGTHRKALKVAVAALCCDGGFSYAEDAVLETLTEMIQSYIFEVGRGARAFSELSCRTEPMLSDVAMSLVEMGTNIEALPEYAKRKPKQTVVNSPAPSAPAVTPKVLPIGERNNLSSHIPPYLPPFPDPHTYIKTLTHREPESEYQILREKAATQKRDVERALTRFIAKTGETESLFPDDPYAFPLIANKPKPLPYLDALLPKEQDMEGGEDSSKTGQTDSITSSISTLDALGKDLQAVTPPPPSKVNVTESAAAPSSNPDAAATGTGAPTEGGSEQQIDNPYLRAIIMPKIGRTVAKKSIAATSSAFKW